MAKAPNYVNTSVGVMDANSSTYAAYVAQTGDYGYTTSGGKNTIVQPNTAANSGGTNKSTGTAVASNTGASTGKTNTGSSTGSKQNTSSNTPIDYYTYDADGKAAGIYSPDGSYTAFGAPVNLWQTSQPSYPTSVPAGSSGSSTNGYTGTFLATDPDNPTEKTVVRYENGKLVTEGVKDGTIVHTGGGDFAYYKPKEEEDDEGDKDKHDDLSEHKVSPVPSTFGQGTLNAWLQAAQQQATNSIDFATQRAIAELMRNEEDSQAQFNTQRNQIAIDEARAKDNQALYAESRGDKGGIGSAQYDSIMNTAAQNRLAVSQAQTKLSTDTARQIADLRAQGEFEKADALLELSQTALSQLISLEQWAAQHNLSVAQFNAGLDQWAQKFQLGVAGITGVYNGQPTFQAQQYNGGQARETGYTLLSSGIMPSDSQLQAMGMTREEAQSYIDAQNAASNKESAIAQVKASINAGKMPSDVLIQAAGYDKATLQGLVGSANSSSNRSAAEKQVRAMISIGEVPSIALIEAAGWDYDTVVSLATANKTATKTSPGGGGGGAGTGILSMSVADIYANYGDDAEAVRHAYYLSGAKNAAELGNTYENWLEGQKNDDKSAKSRDTIKQEIGRKKAAGVSNADIVAYVNSCSGNVNDIHFAELRDYLQRIGVVE